ncbi:50S ribosomal protein L18Ae [Desulfurococcus amylolyticus]|uniref:Large ribosomal subunit protein eL20 n=1 Tax=Desulfurococcus amylolyticus (strain DSM 18924 / JCM 16383 / VKM B-2413 / 1221n) TaxID=490899 RepID=B8D5Q4_DESA1|nr:50S ribosomal protein L18Ae [Desulfurococcus amylolyticus]ACL11435.1 50S ribosomal protein LX [Desulfurococcus amylolyticus 1221n]
MEVKTYRVTGYMLISHDRYPTWQRFTKDVRGVSEKEVLEKVYSILGSNHKVKRYHIRIERIEEIDPSASRDPFIRQVANSERIVKP